MYIITTVRIYKGTPEVVIDTILEGALIETRLNINHTISKRVGEYLDGLPAGGLSRMLEQMVGCIDFAEACPNQMEEFSISDWIYDNCNEYWREDTDLHVWIRRV